MPVSAVIVPSIHNHLTRAESENSTLRILKVSKIHELDLNNK